MKMTIALIRNAATQSGLEGRFIGMRDEPLSPLGEENLARGVAEGRYPSVQLVFTSGLVRCVQTARCVYPNQLSIVLNELRPYDYGDFEGMSYEEIITSKWFERFAAARRLIRTPGGGEDPYAFLTRCGQAFRHVVLEAEKKGVERVGIITHQMVIRLMMQRFCVPRAPYRDWTPDFGGGYLCEYNPEATALRVLEEI